MGALCLSISIGCGEEVRRLKTSRGQWLDVEFRKMEEKLIRAWLNGANQKLLAEVVSFTPVKFTLWEEDYFACQVHKDEQGNQCEAEVFYKEPLEQAKIVHELLHAKTSLILGDNGIMYDIPDQTRIFQYMMDKNNASAIVNACEHVIFFPDYLAMGFEEADSFEQPKDLEARRREMKFKPLLVV